jgi:hypothetical protein
MVKGTLLNPSGNLSARQTYILFSFVDGVENFLANFRKILLKTTLVKVRARVSHISARKDVCMVSGYHFVIRRASVSRFGSMNVPVVPAGFSKFTVPGELGWKRDEK